MTLQALPQQTDVIVVDDNIDSRRIYGDGLAFLGLRVETVDSAHLGILRAQSLRPKVVIMDVMMPGLDGITATEMLRANVLTRMMGIVVLTALREELLRHRAKAAGADFFVMKPCTPKELAVHVYECVRRRRL